MPTLTEELSVSAQPAFLGYLFEAGHDSELTQDSVSLSAEFPDQDDPAFLIDSCFDARGFSPLLYPTDVNGAVGLVAGLMPLYDIQASRGPLFREGSNLQSNEEHREIANTPQDNDKMPYETTINAPSQKQRQAVRVLKPRQNEYNSRLSKINYELHRLQEEGKVKLTHSDEHERGIGGGRVICGIESSVWALVVDRLNTCIASWSKKAGTPSENLTQCLRDCGVVPRMLPGRTNYNWRQPAGGVWEFCEAAWQDRQKRLKVQYSGGKRKREGEDEGERTDVGGEQGGARKQRRRRTTSSVAARPKSSSAPEAENDGSSIPAADEVLVSPCSLSSSSSSSLAFNPDDVLALTAAEEECCLGSLVNADWMAELELLGQGWP